MTRAPGAPRIEDEPMADMPASPTDPEAFVPAAEYRDAGIARLERERLWPRTWQMACREADLARPGDFAVFDLLDDSILLVRNGDGRDDVAAMHNVCQHRGRRLCDAARGRFGKAIACRFHGWQYGLDGALRHVHFEEDWAGGIDRNRLGLPRVRLERWGGWLWVNLDDAAPPLGEWLGEACRFLDPFSPETMRPTWWRTIVAPVNWKVVVEAFIEAYHSGATHLSGIDYRTARMPGAAFGNHSVFFGELGPYTDYRDDSGRWVTPGSMQENLWANFMHLHRTLGAMVLEPGVAAMDRLRALPPDTPMDVVLARLVEFHREEHERRGVPWPETLTVETWAMGGTDWHLFPNSIVLPTLDGALWYRVLPDPRDDDRCRFDIWSLGRFADGAEPRVEQEVFDGFDAFRGRCSFLDEDFTNLEAVHRGMKSRGFRGATLNPVQEKTVAHFHAMLRRFLGDASR